LRGVWGNPWGFESPLRHQSFSSSKSAASFFNSQEGPMTIEIPPTSAPCASLPE
jgi:hypothetical protein